MDPTPNSSSRGDETGPAARERVLLEAYAAYNRRDSAALLALVTEDVDWPDDEARLRGKDELHAYWERQWERIRTHDEPVEIAAVSPGASVARIRQVVRALDGSTLSRGWFTHTFRFAGNLIQRMDIQDAAGESRPHDDSAHTEAAYMNNEELVRHLYDRFNARDIDGVLSLVADDVAWANGMEGGHVHGREAVRAYWTRQWAAIDPHVDPVNVGGEADGWTPVEVHQVVRDLDGRLLLDETVVHAFRIEGGRVTRFDVRSASQLSAVKH